MQLACFLYIKRAWICDKRKLQNLVDYFCALTYKFTLLLFPEGTDLTETTKEISDKYAKQNGLGVSSASKLFSFFQMSCLEIRVRSASSHYRFLLFGSSFAGQTRSRRPLRRHLGLLRFDSAIGTAAPERGIPQTRQNAFFTVGTPVIFV